MDHENFLLIPCPCHLRRHHRICFTLTETLGFWQKWSRWRQRGRRGEEKRDRGGEMGEERRGEGGRREEMKNNQLVIMSGKVDSDKS